MSRCALLAVAIASGCSASHAVEECHAGNGLVQGEYVDEQGTTHAFSDSASPVYGAVPLTPASPDHPPELFRVEGWCSEPARLLLSDAREEPRELFVRAGAALRICLASPGDEVEPDDLEGGCRGERWIRLEARP